jgi:ATP-dependent DNA ligase
VLDGELIVWDDARGRTSFAHLQQRLTAGRRHPVEAAGHPAYFVVFDLLQDVGGRVLLDQPLARRRRRLDRLLAEAPAQLPLCPQTSDERTARGWWADWAVTGVEGLVVKKPDGRYRPGAVGWVKVKTRHTQEMIIGGVTGALAQPEALLLGRYDRGGVLRFLTCTHRLRAGQRRELAGLQPMVFSGPGAGHPWPCPLPAGWAGRFADRTPLLYLPVDPTLIAEIETDAATDEPFGRPRHGAVFVRVRPDLHPRDVPRV